MQLPSRSPQPHNAPRQGWAAPRAVGTGAPRVLGSAPEAASYGPHHARYAHLIHDLRPGEALVVLLRRHVAVLALQVARPGVLLCLWLVGLLFALPFVDSLRAASAFDGGYGSSTPAWVPTTLLVLYFTFGVLLALWVAYLFLEWKDDWIALTTRRLIMMDKTLFLHESRREVPLQKVQNIVATYPRVLSMSLDFGDLTIDTPGVGTLVFKDMPYPRQMREAIFLQQRALQANQPPPEERRKAAMRNLLQGPANPGTHNQPTPPNGYPRVPGRGDTQLIGASLVSGNGLLNRFFPFAPQRAGGSVTWHKHWIYLARGLLLPALVYALALVGWLGLRVSGAMSATGAFGGALTWAAALLLPVCLVWAVWNWEDWRNDLYRLDKERLYHVESLPFGLREQSNETLVGRITDVSYSVPGPMAHLLNFGDVVIRTPGESTEFFFRGIPHPREVQHEIMARLDEYRLKDQAGVDREIEAWIKAYDDVRQGK